MLVHNHEVQRLRNSEVQNCCQKKVVSNLWAARAVFTCYSLKQLVSPLPLGSLLYWITAEVYGLKGKVGWERVGVGVGITYRNYLLNKQQEENTCPKEFLFSDKFCAWKSLDWEQENIKNMSSWCPCIPANNSVSTPSTSPQLRLLIYPSGKFATHLSFSNSVTYHFNGRWYLIFVS